MADKSRPALSDAERVVLETLWEGGPATVRAVLALLDRAGSAWTRSTVITLLTRLERKGYVESDKSRFAFVFRAVASREDVMHERMSELAEELSQGDAAPLMLAFAKRHRFTPDEIRQFRQAIEAAEARRSTRRPRK